ncbi:Lipid A 3-O-deacylase (PagL) [Falsiruegeria litorea R37]|uniref:Lipid A 3-O-deacylase (PagL) n=1 Tax=Falsiruegeria litorea R37 TaxID=1200284 RepID=A0A1Y5RXA8_9RHOB|nr:acyloxyacyl hydrolase [Falsiruegeria litorea]SLN25098.1 Lipid A 3-O-deacylase (PagL) [Falsiruegeria litorea R37]
MKHLAVALSLAMSTAAPLHAQSLILGLGYADFEFADSSDQALASIEYQHAPFHQRERFSAAFAGAASIHANGDVHLGVGIAAEYKLNQHWFIEASVLPGAFIEADSNNDLGSKFEVRSLLGLGYRFERGDALSLAITHKSNASVSSFNPGVNAVLLRYHVAF